MERKVARSAWGWPGRCGGAEGVVAGTLLVRLGLVKMEYEWGRARLFAGAVFCTPCL